MLALGDPAAIAELGKVLRASGFSGPGVQAVLGGAGGLLSPSADIPLHERRLQGAEPLGPLIRLFVLDRPVSRAEAERALAPVTLEQAARLGVIAADGDLVRPLLRIVPHDELLIASDPRLERGTGDAPADHVAGVHNPSLTLAHLTVRTPVERALDLGTGNGVQALLTAAHAEHVVGTDLNERALEFAAFNAGLNEVANVEFRAGSFFEPIAGERFGLITSNPPYVISPESEFLFRDSGLPGDSVSRGVVMQAPAHLEEGGFATLLISWMHAEDDDWSVPLREWVEGSGCDAWLLHYKSEDALTHAGNWNRDDLGGDPEAYGATLDRWLAYFAELGAEQVAHGAIVLRRRAGPNWVLTAEQPQDRLGPASDQILRVFDAQDWLQQNPDPQALLAERFELAPRDRLEQRVVFRDGDWRVEEMTLSLEEGVGFQADIDSHTVRLLASLDTGRPLGQLLEGLAREAGADDATKAELTEGVVRVFRAMLDGGFLIRL